MREQSDTGKWFLDGETVRVASGGWGVEISPASPMSVMKLNHHVYEPGNRMALHKSKQDGDCVLVLGLDPHPNHTFRPEEIYIRHHDLIVRYSQSESDLFAIQLDWRLKPCKPPFSLALEVWISIQTQLLDTRPTIGFHSSGPGAWQHWTHFGLSTDWSDDRPQSDHRAAQLSSCDGASLLWLIDPRDQAEVCWEEASSGRRIEANLFGQFLEKGVIRRARCRFLVGSDEVDIHDIQAEYQDLVSSSLPLTA